MYLVGLVTADTQYQFRATHDARRKPQSEEGQRLRTRRMPPSMVYGISTRYFLTFKHFHNFFYNIMMKLQGLYDYNQY